VLSAASSVVVADSTSRPIDLKPFITSNSASNPGTVTGFTRGSGNLIADKFEPAKAGGKVFAVSGTGRLSESEPVKEAGGQEPAAAKTPHADVSKAVALAAPAESAPLDAGQDSVSAHASSSPQKWAPVENPMHTLNQAPGKTAAQSPLAESAAAPTGRLGTDGLNRSAVVAHGPASESSRSPEAPALEESQALASSGPTLGSAPNPARQARAAHPAETVPHGPHLVASQIHGANQEVANLALERNPAGERSAAVPPVNPAGGISGEPAGARAQEAFSALDEAPGTAPSAWIHAGTHRAEAGFQDPALGWVGVRADGSGSGIHAALVPGSGDAAQVLGSHIAGLNTYLTEHHTPVETLTVAAGREGEASMDQGTKQETGQGPNQDSNPDRHFIAGREAGAPPLAASSGSGARFTEPGPTGQTPAAGGVHISVIA